MNAAPEIEIPEAAASIPTDSSSSVTLPIADVPLKLPTLEGRQARTHQVWEVRTRMVVDGEVETWIYRRQNAAWAHARRLRAQGYPVMVARAAVGAWSVVG